MAVVFMSGVESGNNYTEGLTHSGGANVASSTRARTGVYSIRIFPSSGTSSFVSTGIATTRTHFGLYIATLPSVPRVIHASTGNPHLKLTSTGTIEVYNAAGTLQGATAALSTATWYWIAMDRTASASTCLWVDGTAAVTGTLGSLTGGSGDFGCTGTEATSIDIYLDDIIQDNATILGPSKVALLLPISDNARATLWTGGSGGTTNLWDAVNNVPPAGLATESDTSQIEHAGGAAGTTDAYDANMTTYATAGVATGDTVLAVQGLIVWGEDSATGAKLLSYSGVSNPSWTGESSIDVSTGDGSGATLDYAGTTTDKWNERRGTIATSPSVTLGTSPVMRVVRPETATRVASVCFMGMNVAWTPAAAAAYLPPPAHYPPLLAQ